MKVEKSLLKRTHPDLSEEYTKDQKEVEEFLEEAIRRYNEKGDEILEMQKLRAEALEKYYKKKEEEESSSSS